MALSRGRRYEAVNYWPGFVDALSTMLLVIIFLLSVFMLAQFFLSREVTGKDEALARLNRQIEELTNLLALERTQKSADETKISILTATLDNAEREQKRLKDAASQGAVDADAASGKASAAATALDQQKQIRLGRSRRSTCSTSRSRRCASSWRRSRTRSRRPRRPARRRSPRSPTSASASTSRWRRRSRSSTAIAPTSSAACGRSSARGPTSAWWATASCSNLRCCSTSARPTSARRGQAVARHARLGRARPRARNPARHSLDLARRRPHRQPPDNRRGPVQVELGAVGRARRLGGAISGQQGRRARPAGRRGLRRIPADRSGDRRRGAGPQPPHRAQADGAVSASTPRFARLRRGRSAGADRCLGRGLERERASGRFRGAPRLDRRSSAALRASGAEIVVGLDASDSRPAS